MASLIIDHDVTVSNQLGGAVAFLIMGQFLVLYMEIMGDTYKHMPH